MWTLPPHSPLSPTSIYDLIYCTRGLIYTFGIFVVEASVPLFGYYLKEQAEKNLPDWNSFFAHVGNNALA